MSTEVMETMDNSTDVSHSHLDDIFNVPGMEAPSDSDAAEENSDAVEETEEVEDEVEETVVETDEPQEENDGDELTQLRQRVDEYEKRDRNAQNFIAKQGNEMGDIRKEIEALKTKAERPELTDDEYLNRLAESPVATNKEMIQAELDRRDAKNADEASIVNEGRQTVLNLHPEFETQLPAVKEWFTTKGADEGFVQNLTLEALYKSPELAVALGDIGALTKQLGDAKKNSKRVIAKINKGGSAVTSKTGKAPSSESTGQIAVHPTEMSYEALTKAMNG